MKQFKKISLRLLVIFCFLPLATLSLNASEGDMIGYIRMRPIQIVSQHVMKMLDQFDLSPERQGMINMFLALAGYPHFPGIAENENISAFCFEGKDQDYKYVILIKATPDSIIEKFIANASIMSKREGDWIIMGQHKSDLKYASKIKELLEINAKKNTYDIECKLLVSNLHERLKDLTDALYEENQGVAWTRPIFNETQSIKWTRLGISFSKNEIKFGMAAQAAQDTELAQVLSQKTAGDIAVAHYIPADGTTSYMGKFDPQVTLTYWNYLSRGIKKEVLPELKPIWNKFNQNIAELLKMSDGTIASTDYFFSSEGDNLIKVAGGHYTDEAIQGIMESMANDIIPPFFANLFHQNQLNGVEPNFNLSSHFEKHIFEHRTIPVHQFSVTYSLVTEDKPDDEEEVSIELFKPSHQERTKKEYIAVVNGTFLQAYDEQSIRDLIDRVKDQKPLSENITSLFEKQDKHSLIQASFNVEQLAVKFAENLVQVGVLNQDNPSILKLKKSYLQPVYGECNVAKGSLNIQLSMPVKTLSELIIFYQDISKTLSQLNVVDDVPDQD